MRPRHVLPVTIGVALAVGLLAAPPSSCLDTERRLTQFSRDLWSTNDGLPDGEIAAITQTADGYLWLATQRGLARFEGVQFRLVTRETTPGLPVNYGLSLARTRDGALWLGSRGLGRYADGHWQFFTGSPEPQHPYVFALAEDEAGRLWVGTGGSGIWSFDEGRLTQLPAYRQRHLPSDVLSLAPGRDGTRCARSRVRTASSTSASTSSGPARRAGSATSTVRASGRCALLMDRDGGLWIGTAAGLNRLREGTFLPFRRTEGLDDEDVQGVHAARDGDEAAALFERALVAGCPFRLVILDQTVPGGMGGRAALRRLRSLRPAIHAVAASGYTSDPVTSDPGAHGFCAALVKPYTVAELGATVARALAAAPAGSERA